MVAENYNALREKGRELLSMRRVGYERAYSSRFYGGDVARKDSGGYDNFGDVGYRHSDLGSGAGYKKDYTLSDAKGSGLDSMPLVDVFI